MEECNPHSYVSLLLLFFLCVNFCFGLAGKQEVNEWRHKLMQCLKNKKAGSTTEYPSENRNKSREMNEKVHVNTYYALTHIQIIVLEWQICGKQNRFILNELYA